MRIGEVCLNTNNVIKLANFYKQLFEIDDGSNDEIHQTLISEETQFTIYNDGSHKSNDNQNICLAFTVEDIDQMSRLFYRSLIKFLAGKKDIGVNVANEIVTFMNSQVFLEEKDYKSRFSDILRNFDKQFPLQTAYYELLCELIGYLDRVN